MLTASNTLAGFDLDGLSDEAINNESERVLLLSPEQCYCEKQVRTVFDESDINELTQSLKNTWQQQAIVVYPADEQGLYKIDKGERRWRAAKTIEGFKLKAIVDTQAPQRDRLHQILGQLVENDSRVNLPIIDMANALDKLVELGLSQDEIAIKLGWVTASNKPNRNKVCRILSVLKLPEEGVALVKDNIVSDLVTLELFRKLHETNNDRFNELCDLSRENNGISRKELEIELKETKKDLQPEKDEKSQQHKPEHKDHQGNPSEDKDESPQQHNLGDNQNDVEDDANLSGPGQPTNNETVIQADVKVECLDGRKGVLVLYKMPEHKDEVYVAFDNDEIALIKIHELRLRSLDFH